MNQDKVIKISPNEAIIIDTLRTLKPFEEVRIVADKSGKAGYFLVIRSSKVILTDHEPLHV